MVTPWEQLNRRIVACRRCPRLRDHCRQVAIEKRRAYRDQDYWGKPVPNFGDPEGRLLIVGLAPAAHGANRTGRMFTGDRSGEWLYQALFKAGFANQLHSESPDDGLQLVDCAITATCHCAPPDNKPTPDEIETVRSHIAAHARNPQPRDTWEPAARFRERALALASALSNGFGLTMRKSCAVLRELVGISLSPGGLSQALARIGRRLAPTMTRCFSA